MASPTNDPGDANLVEVKGRTVDEAVARGLVRLGGVGRGDVYIEVVSAGKAGVLGFGHEEALVRMRLLAPGEKAAPPPAPAAPPASAPPATPAAPPAAPEPDQAGEARPAPARTERRPRRTAAAEPAESAPASDEADAESGPAAPAAAAPAAPRRTSRRPSQAAGVEASEAAAAPGSRGGTAADEEMAHDIVVEMLTGLGFKEVVIERMPTLLPDELAGGEEPLILAVQAPGIEGLLSGEAAPLQALQLLVRLILNRRAQHWVSVMLEVNGDRARRMRELCHLAEKSASLVEREGRPVSLPPMSAYERRVVHLALQEHPLVATQSIGSGDNRKVTVRRKDQLLPDLN